MSITFEISIENRGHLESRYNWGMVVHIDVSGNVAFDCYRAKSGANWIGVCDALKLTVQGETYADLMEDIGLTLEGILRDLHDSNELPAFLKEHGWRLEKPLPKNDAKIRFDVPFVPQLTGEHGTPREFHQ